MMIINFTEFLSFAPDDNCRYIEVDTLCAQKIFKTIEEQLTNDENSIISVKVKQTI